MERRKFLKFLGIAGMTAVVAPKSLLSLVKSMRLQRAEQILDKVGFKVNINTAIYPYWRSNIGAGKPLTLEMMQKAMNQIHQNRLRNSTPDYYYIPDSLYKKLKRLEWKD